MPLTQVAQRGTFFWLPLAVALASAAFLIGLVAGFGLPRVGVAARVLADGRATATSFCGVAAHSMSDAARVALYESPAATVGVAANSMRDAARQPITGPSVP